MLSIEVKNLSSGKYGITKDSLLCFKLHSSSILEMDKESALEIMCTLLDSLNLLDKGTEELIYKIEEKLYGDN